jgi:hypothetical protein
MQITRKVNFYVLRPQQRNLFRKIKSYARSASCKIPNYLLVASHKRRRTRRIAIRPLAAFHQQILNAAVKYKNTISA